MDENNNFNNSYGESNAQQSYNQNYGGPYMTPEEAPMTMAEWLITLIVGLIPFIGIIMLFVWAFGSTGNVNRRNYCRAQLIIMAVGMGLAVLFWGAIVTFVASSIMY
ncbi:MAG: hypothetical protein ACOCM8_07120 [Acetivibrio ethanolgignens]